MPERAVPFHLNSPCSDCPFRREGGILLSERRVREITEGIVQEGYVFPCHKTVNYEARAEAGEDLDADGTVPTRMDESLCAGAMIVALKGGDYPRYVQIGERLGLIDRSKLDLDAPTWGSFREMVEASRG